MIKRIKRFIYSFLPTASKALLLQDLEAKEARINELKRQLIELRAYTNGLERGMRSQRYIKIYTGGEHGRNDNQES